MSGATEGVVLGILHYGGINTACTEVGQSGAKRFSIEDEWCARARPRRAHDGWMGPSGARRRCWISRTRSIRLVHTWAWRADEKRSCVIYKTTERGSELGTRGREGHMRHVPFSSLLYSFLALPQSGKYTRISRGQPTSVFNHIYYTIFLPSMGLCISTTSRRQSTGRINQGAISGDSNAESPSMSFQSYVGIRLLHRSNN